MIKRLVVRYALLATVCALAGGTASVMTAADARAQKALRGSDVLVGELNIMRVRMKGHAGRVDTFQIVSEARRLMRADGMCNLETGPETFEVVTHDSAEAAQLRALRGKTVSIKVKEVSCAREAGQYSDAVVTKWSIAQ